MTSDAWQLPFVDVFSHFQKKAQFETKGRVEKIMDKGLRAYVTQLKGPIPASTYIKYPKASSQSLGLNGRYLYVQFAGIKGLPFVMHFEAIEKGGTVIRVSFSNIYKEFKATSTWLQFPVLSKRGKFSFFVVDLVMLLSTHLSKKYVCLKSIQLCSNLRVKGVFTSNTLFTDVNALPRAMRMFVPKDLAWEDVYDLFLFPRDGFGSSMVPNYQPQPQSQKETVNLRYHQSQMQVHGNVYSMANGTSRAALHGLNNLIKKGTSVTRHFTPTKLEEASTGKIASDDMPSVGTYIPLVNPLSGAAKKQDEIALLRMHRENDPHTTAFLKELEEKYQLPMSSQRLPMEKRAMTSSNATASLPVSHHQQQNRQEGQKKKRETRREEGEGYPAQPGNDAFRLEVLKSEHILAKPPGRSATTAVCTTAISLAPLTAPQWLSCCTIVYASGAFIVAKDLLTGAQRLTPSIKNRHILALRVDAVCGRVVTVSRVDGGGRVGGGRGARSGSATQDTAYVLTVWAVHRPTGAAGNDTECDGDSGNEARDERQAHATSPLPRINNHNHDYDHSFQPSAVLPSFTPLASRRFLAPITALSLASGSALIAVATTVSMLKSTIAVYAVDDVTGTLREKTIASTDGPISMLRYYDHDSSRMIACTPRGIKLWRTKGGALRSFCIDLSGISSVAPLVFHDLSVYISSNGTPKAVVGMGAGKVLVINLRAMAVEAVHQPHDSSVDVVCVAACARTHVLYTGDSKGLLKAWKTDAVDHLLLEARHDGRLVSVEADSNCTERCLVLAADGTLGIFNSREKCYNVIARSHTAPTLFAGMLHPTVATSSGASRNKAIARAGGSSCLLGTCSLDGTVRMWELSERACTHVAQFRFIASPNNGDADSPTPAPATSDIPTTCAIHPQRPHLLYIGYATGGVCVFDWVERGVVRTIDSLVGAAAITGLHFTADGHRLHVVLSDGSLALLCTRKNRVLKMLRATRDLCDCRHSGKSFELASATGAGSRLHAPERGQEDERSVATPVRSETQTADAVMTMMRSHALVIARNAGENLIAVATPTGDDVTIISAESFATIARVSLVLKAPGKGTGSASSQRKSLASVSALALDDKGKNCFVATQGGKLLQICIATATIVAIRSTRGAVAHLFALGPDCERLLAVSGRTIHVWEATPVLSEKPVFETRPLPQEPTALSYSAQDQILAVCEGDGAFLLLLNRLITGSEPSQQSCFERNSKGVMEDANADAKSKANAGAKVEPKVEPKSKAKAKELLTTDVEDVEDVEDIDDDDDDDEDSNSLASENFDADSLVHQGEAVEASREEAFEKLAENAAEEAVGVKKHDTAVADADDGDQGKDVTHSHHHVHVYNGGTPRFNPWAMEEGGLRERIHSTMIDDDQTSDEGGLNASFLTAASVGGEVQDADTIVVHTEQPINHHGQRRHQANQGPKSQASSAESREQQSRNHSAVQEHQETRGTGELGDEMGGDLLEEEIIAEMEGRTPPRLATHVRALKEWAPLPSTVYQTTPEHAGLRLYTTLGFNAHAPSSFLWHAASGRLFYAAGTSVVVEDVDTKEQALLLGHKVEVSCLCLSQDGAFIASASGRHKNLERAEVKIWSCIDAAGVDPIASKLTRGLSSSAKRQAPRKDGVHSSSLAFNLKHTLSYHLSSVTSMAFSKDDRLLLSLGHYQDPSLCLWDVNSGALLACTQLDVPCHSLAWDAAVYNEFACVGEDDSVFFFFIDDSKHKQQSTRPMMATRAKYWEEANGSDIRENTQRLLPNFGNAMMEYELNIYRTGIVDHQPYDHESNSTACTVVAYSPLGCMLVGHENGHLSLWDTATNSCNSLWKVTDCALTTMSVSGHFVMIGDESGTVWLYSHRRWTAAADDDDDDVDADTSRASAVGKKQKQAKKSSSRSGQHAPEWEVVVEGKMDIGAGTIMSCSVDDVLGMAIVATIEGSCFVVKWGKRPQCIRLFSCHTKQIRGLCVGEMTGRACSCGEDGSVRVWEGDTQDQLIHFQTEDPQARALAVSISPDERYVVAGFHNGVVRVFNLETIEMEAKFIPHKHPVTAVTYSLDGRVIISGNAAGLISVSSASTGMTLRTLIDHKGSSVISFDHTYGMKGISATPETWLACSEDGRISVWGSSWISDVNNLIEWLTLASPPHTPTPELKNKPPTIAKFSPIDPFLILFSSYSSSPQINFFSLKLKKIIRRVRVQQHIFSLSLSPRGTLIAIGTHDRLVKLIDYEQGQNLIALQIFYPTSVWGKDGATTGNIWVYEPNSLPLFVCFPAYVRACWCVSACLHVALRLSASSHLRPPLTTLSLSSTCALASALTGSFQDFAHHSGCVTQLAFTSDSARLFSVAGKEIVAWKAMPL